MHIKAATTLLATAVVAGVSAQETPATGQRGDAIVVNNNPPGVVYVATLPETAFTKGSAYADGGNVKGYIHATASPDGVGVIFKVKFDNLPAEGGPFKYHLHSAPVPENGNCTATLAHLDPFIRGETPSCNSSTPEKCEVGDLSGKHGEVKSGPFEATYVDKYASTVEGIGAFFGNRSFVFHYANKTRISCANFKRVEGAGGDDSGAGKDNCTTATPSAGITSPPTGGVTPPKPSSTFVTVSAAAFARAPAAVTALGAASMFAAAMFLL